jgi:hypothetical protein
MMSNAELVAFLRKNLICVACVVVSIAIGATIYLRSDELPEANKVLADKSKQGELIAANKEDAHQLKEQLAALTSANQAIANRMIRVGQLAENLQYFYRIESETSTKLTDLRQIAWTPPPKNAPKTSFTPVGFALTAQGTYSQLMDLLRKLENGEHYSRVITCNLRPISEQQRGSPLSINLSVELMGIQ